MTGDGPLEDSARFDFSHLLDHTQHVRVEDAAVRAPDEVDSRQEVAGTADAGSTASTTPAVKEPVRAPVCPACGSPGVSDDRFCGGCGTPLLGSSAAPAPASSPTDRLRGAERVDRTSRSGLRTTIGNRRRSDASHSAPRPGPEAAAEPPRRHGGGGEPGRISGSTAVPAPPAFPPRCLISRAPRPADPGADPATSQASVGEPPHVIIDGVPDFRAAQSPEAATTRTADPDGSGPDAETALDADGETTDSGSDGVATRSDPESVPAPNVGESVTISIAEIRKARAALGRSRGPMVLAVHCPDGHPNPPGAPTCRTCAATIVDSDAVKIPRPALGVLEFTDGSVQVLDRPLILGRKPTLDRSSRGEPVRAVVLDDSTRALSRVQAEICFRGWQVQVIDHASVNPTCIEPPGGPIVRLPPGEPVTIEPGSRILFAEVIECRFLEKPE